MAKREQDSYGRKAKQEGYPARSVYKLEEIDQRYKLLRPGARVLDLGCHPGSWMIYAAQKVGPQGRVVGLDIKPTQTPAAWALTLEADIYQLDLDAFAQEHGTFDAVLSDMAPSTSGARDVDHLRSVALAEHARYFADKLLRPGGSFVVKVFMGGDFEPYVASLKTLFGQVSRLRPKGTRAESREIFVIGKERRAPA
jgi:23S rRNA (uridine2552-2'-O)-methyltransferase